MVGSSGCVGVGVAPGLDRKSCRAYIIRMIFPSVHSYDSLPASPIDARIFTA